MNELCGRDLCSKCSKKNNGCSGCKKTDGHPCGGTCVAAECIRKHGFDKLSDYTEKLCCEINALGIDGLRVSSLNLLSGFYVNLTYPLPNGKTVDFLEDNKVYWGTQVEKKGEERCYGVVADEKFILVCEYGCEGKDPEIIMYRKR